MDEQSKKLYDYCGCEEMILPYVWRGAFLAKMCGIEVPDGVELTKMSANEQGKLASEPYSDALAHLMIMYGAGYVGFKTLCDLSREAAKYKNEIYDAENFIVDQSNKEEKEQVSENYVENIFLCTVNSKKYQEIQAVDFKMARKLCDSPLTTIRNGFVYVKDVGFLTLLADVDETMGYFKSEKMDIYIGKQLLSDLTKDKIDKILNDSAKSESGSELPQMPFLLNLVNVYYIQELYNKPYCVEFITHAKAEGIPFDEHFFDEYKKYVRESKLQVTVSAIARKRNICGNMVNWFDYGTTKYLDKKIVIDDQYDVAKQIDLAGKVTNDEALTDDFLINIAVEQFIEENDSPDKSVIEVTFCGKIHLFLYEKEKNLITPIDSDKFRKIPFDYNNVWTTVMEWSRSKLIQKKGDDIVVPAEEMEKIAESDREYAKRMIEEQYSLKKHSNRMLQKLSELKSYAKSQMDLKAQQAKLKNERESGIQEDNQ